MKEVKVGSDFSGVGAFDFAMKRIAEQKGFKIRNVFACDMDKYARISYLANHNAPQDYPLNVYDREIPKEPLDVYISSFPCQSFSLAGKRQGMDDEKGRGILFFNSHEFIKINKPT
jgi:DNA (cytosine-5)-methyltransferase 1